MAKYRILSLDGGGLRGLITVRLLQQLNQTPTTNGWLDKVDLIAGTSTGGILALGIASGRSLEEMANLYLLEGPKIFDDSFWDNLRDLGKSVGADYSNKALKKTLINTFGNQTLGDLSKKVTIPTFDLDNESQDNKKRTWKPKIFHNFAGSDSDAKFLLSDVALYTSSAPTYFPSADGYIDGGVFANNPSMVAMVQAISERNKNAERANVDEIVLLSVGTGVSLSYIKGPTLDWGYAQWVKPLINILMDGVAGISDYQAAQLLGDNYHRLQVVFDSKETIELDDVSKLKRMSEIGSTFDVKPAQAWLEKYWM
ncbi:MAG: CBASS cGAMP-activated phospholipase [Methylophilus sp.]